MESIQIDINPEVESVFNRYPDDVREKIFNLRKLIIDAANEIEEITVLEETLKWGEPSYLTKYGSTIRIDWKEKKPDEYAIYFKCTSRLVPTFKSIYGDIFKFDGDRAIVFHMDHKVPEIELKKCIAAAIMYHKVKKEPSLGM
jgi:hypothetical protein